MNAAHTELSLLVINMVAEGADLRARAFGSPQQLRNLKRSARGEVLLMDAIPTAFLTYMLAQQLAAFGIEDANEELVPLHLNPASDPARGKPVISRFDFHAAIQMHHALAVLILTKGFEGQRQ